MATTSQESRDVRISVPARADYLVLARLTLSALCRLTPLEHADVADLKLAVTEAAAGFVGERQPADALVDIDFRIRDDRLELELGGEPSETPEDERALSQAIVAATVDEFELGERRALLVKRFAT